MPQPQKPKPESPSFVPDEPPKIFVLNGEESLSEQLPRWREAVDAGEVVVAAYSDVDGNLDLDFVSAPDNAA